MSRAPVETGIAYLKAKGARERNLDHIQSTPHEPMVDFTFPEIHHALGAFHLMLDHSRRPFVLGSQ